MKGPWAALSRCCWMPISSNADVIDKIYRTIENRDDILSAHPFTFAPLRDDCPPYEQLYEFPQSLKNNTNMSNRVLSIGEKFPAFKKKAVVSIEKGKEFMEITQEYASVE